MSRRGASGWLLRYTFYGESDAGWVHVLVTAPLAEKTFPSIVKFVHAADWHEREAEDLFGLNFEGHPRLGDFILHDDAWQEGVEPMRHHFDPKAAMLHRKPDADWHPHRVVQEPGAFVMPVGPKYSGVTESVHFLLETVGEDVIRSTPRLFYKWRAIEKLAEGKTADEVLLLAERFAATTAFAHGLAYCQAVEKICAEKFQSAQESSVCFWRNLNACASTLERFRKFASPPRSSSPTVRPEFWKRICCGFPANSPAIAICLACSRWAGCFAICRTTPAARRSKQSQKVLTQLNELEKRLRVSSSFLDRLEEVGIVRERTAMVYGLLGPIARASGIVRDLRRAQPYLGYENFQFDVPSEQEGDGYARLRILFAEARQSVRIMEQAVAALQSGSVREPFQLRAGAALGWVEAPRGGAFHWVRLDENGKIARYRIVPPSFANWHGFHLSVEKFAFQDFPIMLSTFDLSVAENDR